MIKVFQDEPLSLAQAAKITPGNPSFPTIYRWAVKGRNGVLLETILIGSRRYTTRKALQEFFEAVTAAENGDS